MRDRTIYISAGLIVLVGYALVLCMREIRLRSTTADEFVAAADYESVEKVKAILSRRPELLNARDASGMTALFAACGEEDQMAVVKFLLSKGADPNAKGNDGASLLGGLIHNNWAESLELLLKAGANPNAKNEHGELDIWEAVDRRHKEVVRLLIEYGVDVNAKDQEGRTLLHHAVRRQHIENIRLLIEKGAETEVRDDTEKLTALELCLFQTQGGCAQGPC
jgi:ankyrin repeat protein